MIRDRIIVCIASAWDYDPTSKHQLMRILSRHNDVIWINYHGTRRPTLSRGDVRTSWAVLRRVARGIARVGPSFVQVTPLVLPGVRSRPLFAVHQKLLTTQVRRVIRHVQNGGSKPVQLWSFAPDVPFLIDQFDEECFLYYCVDEYSEFEGVDARRITQLEEDMLQRADLVVTTSEALHAAKSAVRPDALLMRHGVDYDLFASSWRVPLQPPADLHPVPRPMFGFFGLVHFWVDCALLAAVARLRPHYSFVLIGECKTDVSDLRRLPNVYLLGRRPNQQLPAYCAGFDAALLPFTRANLTRSVNPIKMYEYLAAGLPIVSTPLPEARRFEGAITFASTATEFAAACDRVLQSSYLQRRAAISSLVEGESWLPKVEQLSARISERLGHITFIATRPASDVLLGPATAPSTLPSPYNEAAVL